MSRAPEVATEILLGREGKRLPCIGAGNIWIEEDYTPRTVRLVQEAIVNALGHTSPGSLEVTIFDDSLRGVGAPFAALRERQLLRTILDNDELGEYFQMLRQHILGVQSVMKGFPGSLVEYQNEKGVELEHFILVVLAADVLVMDRGLQHQLRTLLSAGPRSGVTFMIVAPADEDDFAHSLGLTDQCKRVDASKLTPSYPPEMVAAACDEFLDRMDHRANQPVTFPEVQGVGSLWDGDSTDGVTFSFGLHGLDKASVTMGASRTQLNNALVTGAVGQGKSNLISVIVHSLCQRYAPSELGLYLLDFKEGVTLRAYSNEDHKRYLPHAKALGLEADVDYGLAVLEHLRRIYEQRMAAFKLSGVQNLKEYRLKTSAVMPRILVIIDEFQMMFEGESASNVASLLSLEFRLFRAAGIHFILASQTIANGRYLDKNSDIYAQTPVRIALHNSLRESEATLGSGNVAAADLRVGEAILNTDYGAVVSNEKVRVALADPGFLAKLETVWWQRAKSSTRPPYVFDGTREERVSSALEGLGVLRGRRPALLLGKTITVKGDPLRVDFGDEAGRNLVVFGAGEDHAGEEENLHNEGIGAIESGIVSLAYCNTSGNAEFVLCDLTDSETRERNEFSRMKSFLEDMGLSVDVVDGAGLTQRVRELCAGLADRGEEDGETYLVCLSMERLGKLPEEYARLAAEGPARGVHFICWWLKRGKFSELRGGMGTDALGSFGVRMILRLPPQEVKRLVGFENPWTHRRNRALVVDDTYLVEPEMVIPYLPLGERETTAVLGSLGLSGTGFTAGGR